MKNIMFLFMLILSLPVTFAETQIFSGKAITDSDKVTDGGIFRFTYDERSNKVFVQTPAGGLIVDNGACKPNDVFRVCINSANFSYKNITTYVYYYEIDATIHKLTGSLSANSKSVLTTLLQGESTDITITITNPTDFDITNIIFNYDISNFSVKEVKGCELNEWQMLWKGSLQSKYDKICTATIVAEKEGTYNLAGNLSYFNGFETEKKTTDTLTVKVLPKQLKANYVIDKDIEVKKPFYINISLQNIHTSEDIAAFTAIKLPTHILLIKDIPAFNKEARVLKHSLMLNPGYIINYSLYLEAISEGKEPINYKFDYTIKGISDVIENDTFILHLMDVASPQSSEIKIEQEPANETPASNLTTTKDSIQGSQSAKANETTAAELQSGNKTVQQVTTIDIQKPSFFNTKILLFSAVVFVTFLVVFFVINRIRKRKKGSDELVDTLKEVQKEIQGK